METHSDSKTVDRSGRKFTKGFDNRIGGRDRNRGVDKGVISENFRKIPATDEKDSCKTHENRFGHDDIANYCYRSRNNDNSNENTLSHNSFYKSGTNAKSAERKNLKSRFGNQGLFSNSASDVSKISQSVVNVQVFRGRSRLSSNARGISPRYRGNFRNGYSSGNHDSYSSQCDPHDGFKSNNRHSDWGFENSRLDILNKFGGKGLKSRQRGICSSYGKQNNPVSNRLHCDYRRGIIDPNDNSNMRFSSYRSRPNNCQRVDSSQMCQNKTGDGNPLGMYWPKLSPFKENQVDSKETLNLNRRVGIQDDVDVDLKTSNRLSNCVLSTPQETVLTHNSFNRSNQISGSTKVGCNDSAVVNGNNDSVCSELHNNTADTNINQYNTNPQEITANKTSKLYEDSSSSSLSLTAHSKDLSPSKKKVLKNTRCGTQAERVNKYVNNYSSVAARHCSPSLEVSEPLHSDKTNPLSSSQLESSSKVSEAQTVRTYSNNKGNPDKTDLKPKSSDSSKDKEVKLSDGRRSLPNNNRRKKKKGDKVAESYIYHIELDVEQSFDDQADSFIKQFEMTPWERLRVDHLKFDVHRVFGAILPNAQPVLFGSVVAGTAFKNSDVDIYLKCSDALPAGNVRDFIICYGSAVNKGGFFKQGIKIPFARVPIVKAIHNYTGMSVDISFVVDRLEPHYGLCNSLLVNHLCSQDIRVRNLIMLVLFWAKYHGFVGKYQMSSFTFILLAVFYLQIVEILPPLYKLISVTKDSSAWPDVYSNDPNLLINSNNENLESLYLGFFTFYSQVRFSEVVISVFAGELVLGVLFESPDLLPECYDGYKRLVRKGEEEAFSRSDMSIQEPFNMSWNTTRSVPPKTIELLKQSCLNVCKVFAKFSSEKALLVVHSQYQPTEGEDDTYSWELPCPPSLTSSAWFDKVLKATRLVFNSVLLMEILESADKSEDLKFCRFYVANSSEENPVKLLVSSEYMLPFKERETLVKAYKSKNISAYEKQVKASNLLLEELKKKEKKRFFKATIHVVRNEKNGSVEVSVSSYSNTKQSKLRKNDHKQFVAFLKNDNFKHLLTLCLELDETTHSSRSQCLVEKIT